jgi:serine/threonine protein kinase
MYSFEHHPRTPPLEFRNRSARVFEELGVTAPYMPTSGAGLVREAMAFARLRHIASGRSEAFLAPSRFNAVAAACRQLEKHPELTAKTAKNGLSLPGAISSGQEGGGGMAPEARFDNGMKQFCGKFLKPGFFTDGEARSLQQLFCLLDTDGDSYINLGDLISCSMEDSDSPFAESDMMNHVRTAMNALDADEDGFLGVADYLKFAARLKGFHKQATSASPGKSSAPSSPVRGSQHGSALLSVRSPAPASSLSDRLSLGMLHWPFKAEAVELAAEALGPSISPVSQTTFLSQPLSVPVDEAQNEHSAGDSNVEMPILRKYIIDGAHSRVFEGSFSGKPVSVKVEPLPSDVARQAATLKHLTLLRELSHQNIGPSLMAAFHDATRTMRVDNESHIYFVSSLCPLGALREIAANTLKSRHDEWPLKIRLAQDVASGITYLHNRSILHRDIKTVNIVVDSNFTAKICDFHSAVYLYSSEVQRVLNCTSEFLAPEVAASVASPGLSSDMFSFGICLCELICGPGVPEQPPKFFRRSEKDGYALDKQDVRLRADKKCPHALVELAFSCCQTDPNRRPSASITTSAISSMYEDTYGRKPTVPPTGIMPETRIPPPSIISIAPTSPRDKLISYREGTVIANAADSHGQALTLKEATMTAGMSNRMDEMMRELDTLRVEKEEFRLQLDSERHAKEQMLDDFESKYQDLDGSFKSQQQVNGELADRLELLERMYATTRSELNEAKGSFNYALPNRQSSQQAGLGNDIPTVIQAVGLSRAKPNSTGHLSSAETFTTWHKKFRSTESRDDGNSVSMLWDAHSDLGARIDELVQACMHGRAHESLGEDILRNRVLDQVQDVAREYNETVISGLEDCSSIIDRALRKLEDPGDEHGGNGSEDVTTLEALTPGPAGVGLFDDESESGADTMLDTVGDGADVSDGETILSGMDMSSVAPPSYAAPPPPSFEAQKFPPQQQPPQPPPQGATSKAAVSAASLEAKLRATSLKAYLGADRR